MWGVAGSRRMMGSGFVVSGNSIVGIGGLSPLMDDMLGRRSWRAWRRAWSWIAAGSRVSPEARREPGWEELGVPKKEARFSRDWARLRRL